MRLTVATVEIAGGEVGKLMAEHLEKKRERRPRKLCGYAYHAALEMNLSQRPAKPAAPLDSHGLLKAWEPPAAPAVSKQIVNVRLKHSAVGRRHAQEASTVWVWDSPARSGELGSPVLFAGGSRKRASGAVPARTEALLGYRRARLPGGH